ncbi:hypothetical protein F383_23283 [Gossypium arboreum]|nr:hypothetical protein F383_23283 [Gossypium arboreum]
MWSARVRKSRPC